MFAVVALALTGFAGATSWNNFQGFRIPSNSNTQCSINERTGFDWTDVPTGSISSYAGFSFNGFSCSNSFNRGGTVTQNRFSPKVIEGTISANDGPSLSCGPGSDFSITQYQISVSNDTDIDLLYDMPDGSTCKQTASCAVSGTVVQNDQCGGAQKVSFQMPQGSSGDCQLGIHSIGFDCSITSSTPFMSSGPSTSLLLPTSTTSTVSFTSATSSSPVSTASSGISSTSISVTTISFMTDSTSRYTSSTPITISSPSVYFSNSSIWTTTTSNISSISENSSAATSFPTTLTATTLVSTGLASSTVNLPPASFTFSSPGIFNTTASPSEHPPVPTASCPDVLPRCMATWIFRTNCTDNSDSSCYCTHSDFTKRVAGCVSAHGADHEVSIALNYFLGICAPFIPQNPGIITDCATQPIHSTSATTSTPYSAGLSVTEVIYTTLSTCSKGQVINVGGRTTQLHNASVSTIYVTSTSTVKCDTCDAAITTTPIPYTTITIAENYTIPCSESNGIAQSSTITYLSTAVTIPQVQFITATAEESTSVSVALVQGPVSALAGPTSSSVSSIAAKSTTLSFSDIPQATTNGPFLATSRASHVSGVVSLIFGVSVAVFMTIVA